MTQILNRSCGKSPYIKQQMPSASQFSVLLNLDALCFPLPSRFAAFCPACSKHTAGQKTLSHCMLSNGRERALKPNAAFWGNEKQQSDHLCSPLYVQWKFQLPLTHRTFAEGSLSIHSGAIGTSRASSSTAIVGLGIDQTHI